MTGIQAYLLPLERAFIFQIVSLTDGIQDYLQRAGSFVASNGWTIMNHKGPEVDVKNKIIFLRGSNSKMDSRKHRIWDLSSDQARDKYLKAVDEALQELVVAVESYNTNTSRSAYYGLVSQLPSHTPKIRNDQSSNKPTIRA